MSDVEQYLAMLNHSYIQHQDSIHKISRHEYLSSGIFELITYDSEMDDLFGVKALEVCLALTRKETFEYIKDPENYRWYLLLMNTPFFSDRTDWGTSIRGAWWQYKIKLNSCAIYDGAEQILDIDFTNNQWDCFAEAMALFAAQGSEARQ